MNKKFELDTSLFEFPIEMAVRDLQKYCTKHPDSRLKLIRGVIDYNAITVVFNDALKAYLKDTGFIGEFVYTRDGLGFKIHTNDKIEHK